ncbi:MAG TPA: glycosyltransferase family 2 protein, partial [Nitrospiria bacterium]|nr:glycosyltransferase family 2 protein [Nitrospiria bacterium]
ILLSSRWTPQPHGKLALVALSAVVGLRYLYWRAFYTLNTADALGTTVSLSVYFAEIYGFLAVVLYYAQVIRPSNRSPIPVDEEALPSVDVFVTVYNESIDVLRRTLVACKAMDYPAARMKVYVLDDGRREEVKALSEPLGCIYVARETNEHAKAGNLNHGMSLSSGEFVMVLDCDHIPVRTFLKETVGFFADPKVAFVQTPHYFYNPDTFQRNLRLEREIVNEQDLFFYVIQPGRDGFNASFFAGSGGIFRRSALMEIGGFQTTTLTEDLHTSLVLHAKGYRSVYLKKILAAGLAPESYRSYLKQRQRWTRGGVQVFLLDNPLWKRGLSFMQRVNYFGSIFYFFHGIPRLVYLTAPLAYLLMGTPPLVAAVPLFLSYYLPYYVSSMSAFNRTAGKFRNPFWSDVYETVMCFFISWTAVQTLFYNPKKTPFNVTPKGQRFDKTQLDRPHVLPHLFLVVLLVAGLGFGAWQLVTKKGNFDAALLSTFWTVYNLLIVTVAIVVARERPQKRTSPRLFHRITCQLSFDDKTLSGKTSDISESGLSLILEKSLSLPAVVTVRLISDFGETTQIEGRVIRNDALQTGRTSIGIRFQNLSDAQRQGIIRQMYSAPECWKAAHLATSATWRSLALLTTASARTFVKEKMLRRLSPRVRRRIPCDLVSGEQTFKGATEDIGGGGLSMRIETEEDLSEGLLTSVIVRLYGDRNKVLTLLGEL